MATIPPFTQSDLEALANVLGDTSDGLTGSEIHHFLLVAKIDDVDPAITKRHRLFNAFAINIVVQTTSSTLSKKYWPLHGTSKIKRNSKRGEPQ